MAQTVRIEPDLHFIKELQEAGGDTLKKCYQCATCSVACPISPSSEPYPRKEMIWAQWGLKDKLMSDMDVWLCHNCGSCSDLCPRGAKPADLMSAMRNLSYRRLAPLPVLGKWMSSARHLPILLAIPVAIFAAIWSIVATTNLWETIAKAGWWPFMGDDYGRFANGSLIPEAGKSGIVFGKLFFGDFTIDIVFSLVALFVLFNFYKGASNLIKSIRPEGQVLMLGKKKPVLCCLLEVIFQDILPHSRFADCGQERDKILRKLGHMSLMFGFVALFVVTALVAGGHWVGRVPGLEVLEVHTPLPLYHPIKLLAIAGTLLLLGGLTLLTVHRNALDPTKQKSGFFDWYLLGVIWAVGLTGLGSMVLRLLNIPAAAYFCYFLHLVSVFMLLAYLPWSKLGHLVYRTTALTYARYMGRH